MNPCGGGGMGAVGKPGGGGGKPREGLAIIGRPGNGGGKLGEPCVKAGSGGVGNAAGTAEEDAVSHICQVSSSQYSSHWGWPGGGPSGIGMSSSLSSSWPIRPGGGPAGSGTSESESRVGMV